MGEHDEDEEDLQRERWYDEEVDGGEVLHVVVEKGAPRGGGRLPVPDHVLLDRRLGDVDAELGELAHDARGAPAWVRRRHLADEVPDLLSDRWSAHGFAGEARPVVAEPAPLPGDDGARLDEDENIPPPCPDSGQPRPEQAVGDVGPGSWIASVVHGELVA